MTIAEILKNNPTYIRRQSWRSTNKGHNYTLKLLVKNESLYWSDYDEDYYATHTPDLIADDWEEYCD